MPDEHLYGAKQASKTKAKAISSSSSLAFSSSLASLISNTSSKTTSSGRIKPSKDKANIFTAHNKNVKKRAAADMLDDGEQRHQTKDDIGSVDSTELQRSKRKMEEKVRLYNAMKRGEHSGNKNGRDDQGLVDFDRKWAESQVAGTRDDSSSSEDEAPGDGSFVQYTDEFGRLRKGTKREAEREERRMRAQTNAEREAQEMSARPSMPSNLIYGDTIQHSAYNPDQVIADRMAEIAKKRDKSATPPPDTHFDASAEVRTKGTGFYGFSQDAEERKKQMDALEKERLETARVRDEREAKKQQRRKDIEERKRVIAEQRSKAQADKFLNSFDLDSS